MGESAQIEMLKCDDIQNAAVLENLGLRSGALVKCLSKTFFNGPRLFEINGERVCTLCRLSAGSVVVKEIT